MQSYARIRDCCAHLDTPDRHIISDTHPLEDVSKIPILPVR